MTSDPKQRPLFTVFNTIASLVGMGAMQFVGPIMAGDSFAGDYNAEWFRIMTPIGIIISVILTVLAIIGIWEKDQTKYFGLGGKQEQVKPKEYLGIIKGNKPLQRLMIAGGGSPYSLQTPQDPFMRQYLQAFSEGVRAARPRYICAAVSRMVDLRRFSNSKS